MTELNILLNVIAAIGAASFWSSVGVWEHWRKGEGGKVDWNKLRKNLIIGAGLGGATYVYTVISGDATPIITGINSFFVAASAYFPTVVLVDKLLAQRAKKPDGS